MSPATSSVKLGVAVLMPRLLLLPAKSTRPPALLIVIVDAPLYSVTGANDDTAFDSCVAPNTVSELHSVETPSTVRLFFSSSLVKSVTLLYW